MLMKKLATIAWMSLLFMNLAGCATFEGGSYSKIDPPPSNLDESARANHNSLLPAAAYDSNHMLDD